MKKSLIALLSLVFVLAVFSLPALAANGKGIHGKAQFDDAVGVVSGLRDNNGGQIVGGDRDVHGCIPSAGYSWCDAKQKCLRPWEEKCSVTLVNRIAAVDQNRFQVFKSEAINAINSLRTTDFEKIRDLKNEELNNLRDLNNGDFNNLSQLRHEGIKAIAALKRGEIEKIKALRAIDLWKVSQLRNDQLGKLFDLNSADVNKLVSLLPLPHLERLLDLNKEEISAVLGLNAEELEQLSQLDENKLKEIAKQPKNLIRPRLKAAVALNKERFNYLLSRERFEFAREKFQEAKENFLQKKDEFLRARERIQNRDCNDSNCAQLREQLRQNAQHVLLNQVNAILHHLEAVQNKNVDFGDVNALIAKFEALRGQLEDDNVSQQMLVDVANEIRTSWGQLKPIEQKGIETALNNRLSSLIEKSDKAYDKMNSLINGLKQQGKDTNALEAALANYKAKIDNLADLNSQIAALIADGNFSEAKELIKSTDKELNSSFKLLKKIISEYKRANSGEKIGKIEEDENNGNS